MTFQVSILFAKSWLLCLVSPTDFVSLFLVILALAPTLSPTVQPSLIPTLAPTLSPSKLFHAILMDVMIYFVSHKRHFEAFTPSVEPTLSPSLSPTLSPSLSPTLSPSFSPTLSPTLSPSKTLCLTFQRTVYIHWYSFPSFSISSHWSNQKANQ